MSETLLKSFDKPDEVREFPFGQFEIIHLDGVSLGRATYQPGWKWSVHNAPTAGTNLCHAPIRALFFQATVRFNTKMASISICCRARYLI